MVDCYHFLDAFAVDDLPIPEVPFQMLTSLNLNTKQWAKIAQQGSWQMVRQNLNTFARHGVFKLPGLSEEIAKKLKNEQLIQKARAMPYQLMSAYKASTENQQTKSEDNVPRLIHDALKDAMDIALQNVPSLKGNIVICPDVSGSMQSPVTGFRAGGTTSVRCIDVAGLVTSAILRKNPDAYILPFEVCVRKIKLNPKDSVLTNADKLAKIGGGGTRCSAPLKLLNAEKAKVDMVIFVSDNESWKGTQSSVMTETMQEWIKLKEKNPKAKLVCIDLQPYVTTQAKNQRDILNIGGFSDEVFKLLAQFSVSEQNHKHYWTNLIEEIEI